MNKIFRTLIKILILTVVIQTLQAAMAGAIPIEEWKKTYGGVLKDDFNSVNQTLDGGYITAGTTYTTNTQTYLVKTDSLGSKQWSKTFGGPSNDGAYSVQQTRDGGYILAGYTRNLYNNDNGWIIKTDSLGNIVWNREYGGSNNDNFISIQQTKDGGYIAAGGIGNYEEEGNGWLIKIDSNGNKQWEKKYDQNIKIYYVRQTKDGGYILSGGGIIEDSPNSYYEYGFVIKTDSYGNKLWEKPILQMQTRAVATSVQQATDGGFIIGGESYWHSAVGEEGNDGILIKTDMYGNTQWERNQEYAVKSIQQTKDGGYILAGSSCYRTLKFDNCDGTIVKTDSNGIEKWQKKFGGSEKDELRSIHQNKDGSYIIAGYTMSSGTGGSDGWLIKLNGDIHLIIISPNGEENWIRGTTKPIIWTYSGSGTYVKIELLKGGLLNQVISSSTPNDGSYDWAIPTTQVLGSDYKIKITSTSNSAYTDTSDNNFIINSGSSVNLLKNPGFEESYNSLPRYWNKYQTGTKATFTYPEIGRVGGKSVAIKYATKETGKVALWQQPGITVVPSKQYKLSGYMKLEGVTGGPVVGIRAGGASIRVNWYNSYGGLIKTDLINKIGTFGWTKFENTYVAPSGATKATVGVDLFNSAGKAWFDDISFTKI